MSETPRARTTGLPERLFRSAIEAAGHAVYITDRDGVIEYVNPAFEETTGYDADEAVGKTPRILKSGERDSGATEELWETTTSGDVWRGELRNRRKSGETYVVERTVAPITDEEGTITHFVAIDVDITDRHAHEQRLERRTERLDELGSILGHDIKNLLTVATGTTEMARETGDLSHLEQLEATHDRMEELTDELRVLVAADESVAGEEPVTLSAVLADAWAATATPEATVRIDTGDAKVRADRGRLKRAFENLFCNAILHGGDAVSIRVGIEDDRLYVADDGPGIPPEARADVFEKGYTTREDGTGYGLAIVESVVEAHGWEIAVTESVDGGARFEITGIGRAGPRCGTPD